MKLLTDDLFGKWLEMYGRFSEENDAEASSELFAMDAKYYESPFDEPIAGREAIHRYWEGGAQKLKDKTSSYEILALRDNLGIARWRAEFSVIESGERKQLDCVFVAEFDENGNCSVFREWWHIQTKGVEV